MKNLSAIALNNTSTTIELCKATISSISLLPGERQKLQFTAIGNIHGHCNLGSFIIVKRYGTYAYKTWGKLEIKVTQTDTEYIFEINCK